MIRKKCYIFDIDGTMADAAHRMYHLSKDKPSWDDFFADAMDDNPIEGVVELYKAIMSLRSVYLTNLQIVCVTGRKEKQRKLTLDWLMKVTYHLPDALYMRGNADHREDYVVKEDILDQMILDGYDPIMAFEDRNSVVDMWRRRGILTAHMAAREPVYPLDIVRESVSLGAK